MAYRTTSGRPAQCEVRLRGGKARAVVLSLRNLKATKLKQRGREKLSLRNLKANRTKAARQGETKAARLRRDTEEQHEKRH